MAAGTHTVVMLRDQNCDPLHKEMGDLWPNQKKLVFSTNQCTSDTLLERMIEGVEQLS